MKRIIIIALAALFMALGFSSCGYNTMVSKEEAVTSAVGNLQAAYQKRADLIPNLVATVKSYAEYEAGTLTAVVEARAKATSVTLDAENLTNLGIGETFEINHANEFSLGIRELFQKFIRFPVDGTIHDRIFIELRGFNIFRIRVQRVELGSAGTAEFVNQRITGDIYEPGLD